MATLVKHLIRDIAIIILTYTGIAYLYRRMQGVPLVRVIAFHDVHDAEWFERVISALASKFHILTPDAFHARMYDQSKINILITFDDGYESWVRTCLPILKRHNIKALFFVNSGLLNSGGDPHLTETYMREKLYLTPKAPLTWDMARELVHEGSTIGGHTTNHRSLRHVSHEELRSEVGEDKQCIEHALGITIQDFAYPFGISRDFSEETEKGIRSVGYTYIYTAEPGFVTRTDAHIPRTLIEKNQPLKHILRWVGGSYDLFFAIRRFIAHMRKKLRNV